MATNMPLPVSRADGDLNSARDPVALIQPVDIDETPSKSPVLYDLQGVDSLQSQLTPPATRSTSRISRTNTPQAAKEPDFKALVRTPTGTTPTTVGLDPLSTQIFLRTNSNTEPTIAQRLRGTGRPESPIPDNLQRQSFDTGGKPINLTPDALKDRRKGTSFLSRLSMRGSWKKDEDAQDSDSELGELREDGSDARALTAVEGDGGGYIPFHKEPTRYIRVKPHNKKDKEFNHLFLAQELCSNKPPVSQENGSRVPATAVGSKLLKGGGAAIWAAEFSVDGRYLAVAGQDKVVRVFSVISTPEERKAHEEEEAARGDEGGKLSAPVFCNKPTREFEGHTNDVLALCWSKNNFLLSSSMDKTVKLWHLSRNECLCTFKHNDLVTSIAFHPTDDRFFLAGSLDAQLRLWSIPDKSVAFSASTPEFITAVAFSPDGKMAICGLLNGMCIFHETEGLKSQFQIHVRSSRGKNAKGSKITGIKTAVVPSGPEEGDVKVLISSNDSRIRVYNLKTRILEVKFKGLENQSSQIHARFSDDAKYIICGSEDRKAYIWDLTHYDVENKDKQPYETFDAHPEVVTTALMAPTKSRQLLSASGDPLYDLCNPPPVTLLSLDESTAASVAANSDGDNAETTPSVAVPKKPEETPAYIERSKHMDGNIIITTDRNGTIKVFRQDCAFLKRQHNQWETGSRISGRLTGVGRSASIATKTSAGSRAHSRRGSVNLGSAQAQPVSDRIISWRQDIEGGRGSIGGGGSIRSERSLSPMKAAAKNGSPAGLASEARRQPYASSPSLRPQSTRSPVGSIRSNRVNGGPTLPPTPSFSLISAADLERQEDKPEGGFWNFSRWRSFSNLRYSTAPSSPTGNGGSQSPVDEPQSIDALVPPSRRLSGRRSLGVNEINSLKVDGPDRRKSIGALVQKSIPIVADSGTQIIAENPEAEEEQMLPSKKRTDSGVGRLSTDLSGDNDDGGEESKKCDGCGGINFKLQKVDDGKMAMVCNRCGTKGEP